MEYPDDDLPIPVEVSPKERDPTFVLDAKEYQRAYYQQRRDAKIKYARERWNANKEELNRQRREERAKKPKNQRRVRASKFNKKEYNNTYHVDVIAEKNLRKRIQVLMKVCGGKLPVCQGCGTTDVWVLTINHINGDGRKERRDKNRQQQLRFYAAILSGERKIDDLNVLCMNCNILYEYQRGKRRRPSNWQQVYEEETRNG